MAAEQITKLDLEIEAYGKSLEDDAVEAKDQTRDRTDGPGNGGGGDGGTIGAKVAELLARVSDQSSYRPRAGSGMQGGAVWQT